jgi:GTP-binding protein EngB required for normal cell division
MSSSSLSTIKNISNLSVVESKTWSQEHTIIFDENHRRASLDFLNLIKDGTLLCIGYSNNSSVSGLTSFQHWFIMTNDEGCTKHFIEFGSIDLDYDNARVDINIRPRKDIKIEKEFRLTEKVRQRIEHVLGMMNYSLCLRNCEQVANYIYEGKWHSKQVESYRRAINLPMGENVKNINIFPSKIIPHVLLEDNEEKIYSFLSDQALFKPTQIQYFLDDSPNTYNVLLIGPTGAGKSRLLNVLFNRKIVESAEGFDSVTKEIYCLRSRKPNNEILPNYNEMILIDTIGLCDSSWDEKKLHQYIKGRINQNFKQVDIVLIAIRNQRILPEVKQNIKKMLDWLNYEKYSQRFVFVITKSENLSPDIIRGLKDELRNSLKLPRLNDDAILFTDFPDSNDLTQNQTQSIQNGINELTSAIVRERQCDKVPITFNDDNFKKFGCMLS